MEYKFRAWHKNNKEMCENVTTDLQNRDYLEFLPSTGVKDINKKESYLGDILKEPVPTYGKQKEVDKTSFYVVSKEAHSNNMYLEYNFNCRGYWEINNSIKLFNIETLEIVGNIYENINLIEKGEQ